MAINTGNGTRQGIVAKRTQAYNPKTEKYVKRDTGTGRFMSCKDTPYKGVRKEDVIKKKKEAKVESSKDTPKKNIKKPGKNKKQVKK